MWQGNCNKLQIAHNRICLGCLSDFLRRPTARIRVLTQSKVRTVAGTKSARAFCRQPRQTYPVDKQQTGMHRLAWDRPILCTAARARYGSTGWTVCCRRLARMTAWAGACSVALESPCRDRRGWTCGGLRWQRSASGARVMQLQQVHARCTTPRNTCPGWAAHR